MPFSMSFARSIAFEVVAMDAQEDAAIFHLSFITLGFVLGDAHADQGSDHAAGGSASAETDSQGRDDRSGGDQWSDSGNGQSSEPSQCPEGASDDPSGGRASSSSFPELSYSFHARNRAILSVSKKHRDIIIRRTPAIVSVSTARSAWATLL